MPWQWYHEVSIWTGAIAIHALVVRWCAFGMLGDRWKGMYWRAYRWSLSICVIYSLCWAVSYRLISAYLSFALIDAVVIWPAITTAVSGVVAILLNRADAKRAAQKNE